MLWFKMDNNNINNLEDQTETFCVSFMTCLVANFGIWKVKDSWNPHSIPGKFCMRNIVWKYVCGYVYECLLLRKKCPYLRLFWSTFSCIPSEYGEMRENADQHNSEYGHFFTQCMWDVISKRHCNATMVLCTTF